MTAAAFDRIAPADNQFEAWARSLCQFVIRATILPVTVLFTKPSDMLKATETGEYRPLPSPFLLALITGIVISGVTSNLSHLQGGADAGDQVFVRFFEAAARYYTGMDGIKAILAAIPYVIGLWIFAGLISACMLRGIRTAESLMTSLSFAVTSLVEITIVLMVAIWLLKVEPGNVVYGMAAALVVYGLVVASKLIRLLFVIRKQRGSPLVGAIFGSLPVLLFISLAALLGAGLVLVLPSQRQFLQDMAFDTAYFEGHRHLNDRNYQGAFDAYSRALAIRETPEAYNQRCWTGALSGEQLEYAHMDCEKAIALRAGYAEAYDSLGLVLLKMGMPQEAYTAYDSALAADSEHAHARYGRGIAHQRLGRPDAARVDMDEALKSRPELAEQYRSYFAGPARAFEAGLVTADESRATFAPASDVPEASPSAAPQQP